MAVKIWDLDESGNLTSTIRKDGRTGLRAEESRPRAEILDREIDKLLDKAVNLLVKQDPNPRHTEFAKRWAIGRAISESGIMDSPHLEPGERADLWRAMARKCRLGVRHTGKQNPRSKWKGLVPGREMEPKRIQDDIFGLGMWLQEQELEDARLAFGNGLHNAKQIWSREALRSGNFRDALAAYFSELGEKEREQLYIIPQYAQLAKALRSRWPSRGKGSAKRPVHYRPRRTLGRNPQGLEPVGGMPAEEIREMALSQGHQTRSGRTSGNNVAHRYGCRKRSPARLHPGREVPGEAQRGDVTADEPLRGILIEKGVPQAGSSQRLMSQRTSF